MLKKLLFNYKTDQGLLVRGSGLGMIAALLCFGCFGLYWVVSEWGAVFKNPFADWLVVPLVDLKINGALVVSVAVFVAAVFAVSSILGRPKTAELLIETETELQKVTWPSWPETVNASIVVIFTTILMALLLFVYDVVLRWLTSLVL